MFCLEREREGLEENWGGEGHTSTSLIHRGEINIIPADRSHRASDIDLQIRQRRTARERDAADRGIVHRALHLAVVAIDDALVREHERGARVGDGLAAGHAGARGAAADREGLRRELPEAAGGVDGGPGERARELGRVDGAELVGAGGVVAEVGREDGLGQRREGVVEEGLLLHRLDRVELAEGEPNEARRLSVGDEARGHVRGELDGLPCHGGPADVHRVSADVACGA